MTTRGQHAVCGSIQGYTAEDLSNIRRFCDLAMTEEMAAVTVSVNARESLLFVNVTQDLAVKAERVGKLSDELWNNFDVEFVEECIQDFDAADSNGEKFRYPGPTIGFSLGEPATDRLYVWFEALDKQNEARS